MKAVEPALHFFGGLAAGMAIYAAHLFFVASNLHGKPTASTGEAIKWGLVWPLISVVYAIVLAKTNPIFESASCGVVSLVVVALAVSVLACLFLSVAIAFSGYC